MNTDKVPSLTTMLILGAQRFVHKPYVAQATQSKSHCCKSAIKDLLITVFLKQPVSFNGDPMMGRVKDNSRF